jgi:hypothetical protein
VRKLMITIEKKTVMTGDETDMTGEKTDDR